MISQAGYWYMHIFGIGLLMLAIGGVSLHAMSGGTKETSGGRRLIAASHGLGLLLILTAGFGMLARLGAMQGSLPGWVWAKLAIWAVIGGLFMVPYRKPKLAAPVWVAAAVLMLCAAWLAHAKPI
ncbi:MAG TPA: hypothetical protein VLA33_03080 [Gemmatimonadota bacterium]|nr:hypothetical protein [Gemmatimonadota bacterium]